MHDRGLSLDLPTILSRRRLLGLLGAAGVAVAAGCTDDAPAPGAETIPPETGGPFPADGSNGVNVLTRSGIVRRDIRTSFGPGSATADGVPLTIALTVSDGSAPRAGAAIYLWQCDREGRYSLYSDGVTGENYLRGVQVADAAGRVTFTSVYPAAYPGRWPHLHFEVYPTVDAATAAGDPLVTSQLALPAESARAVYATPGYERSARHLAGTSLADDLVFRDGYARQLGTVTGDVGTGLTVTLDVPV